MTAPTSSNRFPVPRQTPRLPRGGPFVAALALLAALAICPRGAAAAQGWRFGERNDVLPRLPGAAKGPVHRESFERRPLDGWQFIGGARVAGEIGQYALATSGFGYGVWNTGPLADFTARLRYRHAAGVGDVALCVEKVAGPEHLYHLMIGNDTVVLAREASRRQEHLKVARHPFQPGRWYDLTIEKTGGRFRVAVGGRVVLVADDPRPLPAGLPAFGSLLGSGFAFDDITLVPAAPPAGAVASGQLLPGRMLHGTANVAALRAWKLAAGAQFASRGRGHVLRVADAAEAAWTAASAEDGTLTFRCLLGRGTGKVVLRRSGTPRRYQEYRLLLDATRVALIRAVGRQEELLGQANLRLAPGKWHDVSVFMSRGWMRVSLDHMEILKAVDPRPLPAGTMAFSSGKGRAHAIDYGEVRFTPWTAAQARGIRRLIERAATKPSRVPPKAGVPKLPPGKPQVVPLQIAVYKYPDKTTRAPHPIDPGLVPPNFAHTWTLDLRGIDVFKLYSKDTAVIRLDKGDRITFYGLKGLKKTPPQPLAIITMTATEAQLTVDISTVTPRQGADGQSYRRIFLQLETSPAVVPRRFVLKALLNAKPNTGAEEALVLGDDLNYTEAVIGRGVDQFGKAKDIPAPWKVGYHTNYAAFPRPEPADGWYLIGRNLTDPTPLFYALAYYNEQRGILRLYLYNLAMPVNVSGATVEVSLVRFGEQPFDGKPSAVLQQLKGAIFPLHPNPHKWSSVRIPLVQWIRGSWACVQTPMLYPMAENVPVDPARAAAHPKDHYRSLYEEPLQKGLRGVQLRLLVQTYDYGKLNATLVGKALGDAIQQMGKSGGPSAFDLLKDMGKTGADIISGGKEIYDGIKKYRDDQKKAGAADSVFKTLSSLMSMGSSVFSGGLGIAGAAFQFVNTMTSLFGGGAETQPLQLAIELDLQGVIKGDLKIEHTFGTSCRFYLPGRFPIDEAYHLGLLADNPNVLAAVAPRYDRAMGLFGYRYNPGTLKFRMVRWDYVALWKRAQFIFPSVPKPQRSWMTAKPAGGWPQYATENLDRLLPVIYNPYAEVKPMEPIVVGHEVHEDDFWKKDHAYGFAPESWWKRHRWHFNIAWPANVTPEPDDKSFPHNVPLLETHSATQIYLRAFFDSDVIFSAGIGEYHRPMPQGLLMQVAPHRQFVPSTYRTFKDITTAKVHLSYLPVVEDEDATDTGPFAKENPSPVQDIVYYWDVCYFYYGRTRQRADGSVPRYRGIARLRSPVTIDLTRFPFKPSTYGSVPEVMRHDVESRLLAR